MLRLRADHIPQARSFGAETLMVGLYQRNLVGTVWLVYPAGGHLFVDNYFSLLHRVCPIFIAVARWAMCFSRFVYAPSYDFFHMRDFF